MIYADVSFVQRQRVNYFGHKQLIFAKLLSDIKLDLPLKPLGVKVDILRIIMREEKKLDKEAVLSSDYTVDDIKIDRQLSITCHILGFITSILGPLVFVLTKGNDAEFLRHHEREAFNFQLTIIILFFIGLGLDMYVFEKIMTLPVIFICDAILSLTAVIKANDNVFYKYPISIPFLNPNKKKTATVKDDN